MTILSETFMLKCVAWKGGAFAHCAGWTIAKLKSKHPSQPFNPDIAYGFFRAGMIEAWGRGIERILEACRLAQVPDPGLRYEKSGLWVEFLFPRAVETATTETATTETPVKMPVKILETLEQESHMTLAELAATIGKSLRAVERATARLVKEGKLRFVGPRKGGHWEVLK
jgi:ATP-dependent DNA helicase RecG